LRQLTRFGIIDTVQSGELLVDYDFLKKLEGVLRVADLKNISAFSTDIHDAGNQRLSRAMGYIDDDRKSATDQFMQEYLKVTRKVREHFTNLLGDIEGLGTRG